MDDELSQLEAELKRLRPVAPSRTLTAGVAHALATPRRYWTWAALPLAAALAVVAVVRERPALPAQAPAPVAPAMAAIFKPVSAENLLYDQRDEGLVTLADGTVARRYRSSYVDTITWQNPRTRASLRWSVPRTEQRVIPVSFQ